MLYFSFSFLVNLLGIGSVFGNAARDWFERRFIQELLEHALLSGGRISSSSTTLIPWPTSSIASATPFITPVTTIQPHKRPSLNHRNSPRNLRRGTPSSPTIDGSLPAPNYLPIFFDDFCDQPGGLPSASNWIYDTGTSYPNGQANWGNAELETYTISNSNLQITDSETLLITPIYKPESGWTSARIETQRSDFICPPGRKLFVQARIKLGDGTAGQQQGVWPAFWALGSSFRGNYDNWPHVSEWDIMESWNGDPSTSMTIHCGKDPDGPCTEKTGITRSKPMSRGAWNTFGFEVDRTTTGTGDDGWQSETLNWYLNGEKAFTVDGKRVGDEDAWGMLAHEAHFLLLDVAVDAVGVVGGGDGGSCDGMEVDYVGVWISAL